jgi:hypothetical protein
MRQEPVDRPVVDDRRPEGDELRPACLDKPTFVELVTEGQPPAPGYFVYDAILNRTAHGLPGKKPSKPPEREGNPWPPPNTKS